MDPYPSGEVMRRVIVFRAVLFLLAWVVPPLCCKWIVSKQLECDLAGMKKVTWVNGPYRWNALMLAFGGSAYYSVVGIMDDPERRVISPYGGASKPILEERAVEPSEVPEAIRALAGAVNSSSSWRFVGYYNSFLRGGTGNYLGQAVYALGGHYYTELTVSVTDPEL
jgi:hypothetical protein